MREVVSGQLYRHFKGHIYKVLCIAKDSETLKEQVVYQNIKDEKAIWVRDKVAFLSRVDCNKYKEASQIYRFEQLDVEDK